MRSPRRFLFESGAAGFSNLSLPTSVGTVDGRSVGSLVGRVVGRVVGPREGACEGLCEGRREGASEGTWLGRSEGAWGWEGKGRGMAGRVKRSWRGLRDLAEPEWRERKGFHGRSSISHH
jgi:hypothetical protein